MATSISSTGKWIWCVVIIVLYVISNFENTSFSTILTEISEDLCDNGCSSKQMGAIKILHYVMKIVTGPLFGLLGDRYNRKYLTIGGLCIWSGFNLLMTFMPDYWSFVVTNGLSSAGMTISNNLGPPMLADLFSGNVRVWILGVYSLGTPLGLGLGMVIPSALLEVTGDWRNSLRLTPGITLFCAIIIFFFLSDPPRGGIKRDEEEKTPTASGWSDFKYIMSKTPFVLQMIAVTSTTFTQSTLNYWLPHLYRQAIREYNIDHGDGTSPIRELDVGYIIGVLTIVAGIVGIITGSTLSSYFHSKWQDSRIDPLLIGVSTLVSLPLICGSSFVPKETITAFVLLGFYLIFAHVFVSIGLNFTMSVIAPSKRSFALSLQKTAINAIGKASSSATTGLIIDAINPSNSEVGSIFIYSRKFSNIK